MLPELVLSPGLIASANSIKTDMMRGYLNPKGADCLDPNQRASKHGILIGQACQFTFIAKASPKENLILQIFQNQQLHNRLFSRSWVKLGISVGSNAESEDVVVIYLAQEYFESFEQAAYFMTRLENQFIYLLSEVRKDPLLYASNLKQELSFCKGDSFQIPYSENIKLKSAELAVLNLIDDLKRRERLPSSLIREVTLTEAAHETAELIFDHNYDYQMIPQISRIGYASGMKTELLLEIDIISAQDLLKKVLLDPKTQRNQTRQILLSQRVQIAGAGFLVKKERHSGIYRSSILFFFLQNFITYDDPESKVKIDIYLKSYHLTIFKLINKYRTDLKSLENELEELRQMISEQNPVIRRPEAQPIRVQGGEQKIHLLLETIQLIKEESKLRPLLWNEGLARSARDHCEEMNQLNYFGRERKNWRDIEDQLSRNHIKVTGNFHECLNPGQWDPESVLWNWILGTNDPASGGMRDFEMLFSNQISAIGIGTQPHPTYGETTSAILVGDLI